MRVRSATTASRGNRYVGWAFHSCAELPRGREAAGRGGSVEMTRGNAPGVLTLVRDRAADVASQRSDDRAFLDVVGASPPIRETYEMANRVAPTDTTVLITGESGTGKELLAQAIHHLSLRSDGPMVTVNCGAISPTLMETELFGHEKGSFTGAERRHRGFFERATGGTLFLDEVTEMPVQLQVNFLRVLENASLRRVGGEQAVRADARIIAATNRCPEEAVRQGKLREDLYYRLKVFALHLPPLRERGEDIVALAHHFLAELNEAHDQAKSFSRSAIDALRAHPWPGNVREMKNVIEHAFILASERITPDLLPLAEVKTQPSAAGTFQVEVGQPLAEVERELILRTLERYGGDKQRAADVLGVSVRTIYNRLNAYARKA